MLQFLKSQFLPLPYPSTSFKDQTIIVTGSNVGLGLEAARHFARLGASKLILAVRSISKGEAAAKAISSSTNTNVCEVWQVDVGNFKSVQDFCKRAESLDRLDVVCLNAGILNQQYSEMEGMESSIAVNVVGTFLMALDLLPTLRKSAERTGYVPRLVVTSSEMHAWSKLAEKHEDSIFEACNKDSKEYMADRYSTTKLLQVLVVRELAAKMQSGRHATQPVILNTLHPGVCRSTLARDSSGVVSVLLWILLATLARTTEMGSRTIVASAHAGDETHGKYMADCKVKDPSPFVRSVEGEKTQVRVYDELIKILEKIQPGISQNV